MKKSFCAIDVQTEAFRPLQMDPKLRDPQRFPVAAQFHQQFDEAIDRLGGWWEKSTDRTCGALMAGITHGTAHAAQS